MVAARAKEKAAPALPWAEPLLVMIGLPLAGVAEIVKSNGRPVPAALVAESVAKNCPGRGGVPDSAPVAVSIESQAGRSVAS